jgi:hypothetical protein
VDIIIEGFTRSDKFKGEYAKLDPETRSAADAVFRLLMANPRAATLRLHPLKGYGRPMIWKIDVRSNKSYK